MAAAPPVSLVPAAMSDVELLTSYMRQLRADDPMPQHEFANDRTTKDALESLITDPEIGRIWMIRSGDTPVGYAALSFFHSLEFAGRCGLLDEFFIHQDHRRKGVAKTALKWICESAAPKWGIRAVFLELSPDNIAAAGLYGSMGFKQRQYRIMARSIEFD